MSDAYLPGDTRQRIQDLIKDRKITQAELAENVGLSNSALSRYLQGSTKNFKAFHAHYRSTLDSDTTVST